MATNLTPKQFDVQKSVTVETTDTILWERSSLDAVVLGFVLRNLSGTETITAVIDIGDVVGGNYGQSAASITVAPNATQPLQLEKDGVNAVRMRASSTAGSTPALLSVSGWTRT